MNIRFLLRYHHRLLNHTLVAATYAIALLLSACRTPTFFELDLRPNAEKLDRKLTVWRDPEDDGNYGLLDADIVGRIAALYGAEVPGNLASVLEFHQQFGPRMPGDIGGNGSYLYWPSSLGALYVYSESFRGSDDLARSHDQILTSIDRNIDVLVLWLETEFSGHKDIDRIVTAVRGVIRDDIRNLFLHVFVSATSRGVAFDEPELFMRCLSYLAARGYFEPGQIPQIYSALLISWHDGVRGPMSMIVARGIANRMGFPGDEPLPDPLAALGNDLEAWSVRYEEFVASSEAVKSLARSWLVPDENDVAAATAEPDVQALLEVNTDGYPPLIELFPLHSHSYLRVTLYVPVEPEFTNGIWDEVGRVTWDGRLASNEEDTVQLPSQLFAIWVVPDFRFQFKHFREVVFGNDDLIEYILWRNSLSAERGEKWDQLLESAAPGEDAVELIKNYQFNEAYDDSDTG